MSEDFPGLSEKFTARDFMLTYKILPKLKHRAPRKYEDDFRKLNE